MRGLRYWEVILKRFSYLVLNVLSAIHGMSAIWEVHYWEVSPYYKLFNTSIDIRSGTDILEKTFQGRRVSRTFFNDTFNRVLELTCYSCEGGWRACMVGRLACNYVNNILRLSDGWTNFSSTTSETKRDYQ